MSRTIHRSKGPGYDYWSRRWGNHGDASPTRRKCNVSTKQLTNRAERRIAKSQLPAEATR